MNATFEIHDYEVVRYKWNIKLTVPKGTWQEMAKAREEKLKEFIEKAKQDVMPHFDPERTQFYISFQSKMNFYDTSEMPSGLADGLYTSELHGDESLENGKGTEGGRVEGENILPG